MKKIFIKSLYLSYIYIFIYLFTGILTTPILIKEFGSEYFALFMIVNTTIVYLNNIKLGIPESIVVFISKENKRIDKNKWIIRSFLILTILVFLTIIIFTTLSLINKNWFHILGDFSNLNQNVVTSVIYILIIFAIVKIPFELSLNVFIGMNEVFIEKIYKILIISSNFLLVICTTLFFNFDLVSFCIYSVLLDLLISCVSFFHMIIRYKLKIYYPKNFRARRIFHKSKDLFQLTLTHIIIWNFGIYIISNTSNLNEVTTYSITMKIYIYLYFILTISNIILTPIYGNYLKRKEFENIYSIFTVSLIIFPLFSGFIWFSTILFFEEIVNIWLGSADFYIGVDFILIMGFFFYGMSFLNIFTTFLVNVEKISNIIFVRWMDVFLSIALSIVFVKLFGSIGIAIALSISIFIISNNLIFRQINSKNLLGKKVNLISVIKQFKLVLLPSIIVSYILIMVEINLIIKIIMFIFISILYFLYSYKLLSKEEKFMIIKFLRKDN